MSSKAFRDAVFKDSHAHRQIGNFLSFGQTFNPGIEIVGRPAFQPGSIHNYLTSPISPVENVSSPVNGEARRPKDETFQRKGLIRKKFPAPTREFSVPGREFVHANHDYPGQDLVCHETIGNEGFGHEAIGHELVGHELASHELAGHEPVGHSPSLQCIAKRNLKLASPTRNSQALSNGRTGGWIIQESVSKDQQSPLKNETHLANKIKTTKLGPVAPSSHHAINKYAEERGKVNRAQGPHKGKIYRSSSESVVQQAPIFFIQSKYVEYVHSMKSI